ncbi:MAG TPA: hypothetical protein VF350_01840 [Candidatus Bathyarchaeia archaeon]
MKKVNAKGTVMATLQKYWLALVLLLLTAVSFVLSDLAVFTALVFTFLVPGLIAYRFFNLKSHEIWAFVPIFSVLVSVQLIYYLSLAVGYSQHTILVSFLALTAIYAMVVYKKGEPIKPQKLLKLKQVKKTSLLVFAVIFLISLAVLYQSVWRSDQYGIVLTGSNWQDTPFHYEIIESINQGNFPPQTPNYIGTPLTYHYFVDFHTAIIEKMYGYLPTLMPVLNALFILVFAFAIYALARPYGRRVAVIATVLAVFGWGFSYFGLFGALFNGQFDPNQNYIYQFRQLFGLPSMFDNLLQQRPLLVGLPAFAFVLALLRDISDRNRLILAGIVTGLVYQFHNVAFFCCYVAFAACLFLNLKRFKFSYLYFLLPSVFALPFIFSGGPPITFAFSTAFLADFAQNPFIYYFLNLGIPFVLAIVSFIKPGHEYLKITFLLLFMIPNILLLTPWDWDMYKFFMFAWIPIVVLAGIVLAKTPRILIVTLVLLSIITTASVIIYNSQTNYLGASSSEYKLGLWVRDHTPQNAVFLTYYGIHEPPSMIGGRLRVSSYVYWPYGHGEPLDQVNQREHDIDMAYNGTAIQLEAVVREYNVSYVYIGVEELANYPGCVARFNGVAWLTQVYINSDLQIYKVDWSRLGS